MNVKRAHELVPGDAVQLTDGSVAEIAYVQPWRGSDFPIGCEQRPLVVSFRDGRVTIANPDSFIQLAEVAA